ncbi:MAG: DUF2508 family protein [Oscillospiraceae bacterium]|jgi:hypothetical protein|nr:DUF2508 family protein [Oscillospiraceae bacterium]
MKKRLKHSGSDERSRLLAELAMVGSELNSAWSDFDAAVDADMVESAIFAINGLNSRYGFVLRQIKGVTL